MYVQGCTYSCIYKSNSGPCWVLYFTKNVSALVLHPNPDTYFSDLNMCVNLTKKMRVHVQVKKLRDSAFMVLSQDYPFISLHKMFSVSFEEWTPEYGSVGCVVTRFVKFKTSDLLCNLSSSPIVEYILPPFFLWKLIWQQKMTVPWSAIQLLLTSALSCVLLLRLYHAWCASKFYLPI